MSLPSNTVDTLAAFVLTEHEGLIPFVVFGKNWKLRANTSNIQRSKVIKWWSAD